MRTNWRGPVRSQYFTAGFYGRVLRQGFTAWQARGDYVGSMEVSGFSVEKLQEVTAAALEEAAARLCGVLAELASRLRPFPAFLNMTSVQAVELDLPLRSTADRSCVVVLPGARFASWT